MAQPEMAVEAQAVALAEGGGQVALAAGEPPEVVVEFEVQAAAGVVPSQAQTGMVELARAEIPAVPDGAEMEMVVAVSPVPAKQRRIHEHFLSLTLPIGQIKKKPWLKI